MKIEETAYDLSVNIVQLAKTIRHKHREYDLARQLFRSGTSIAANIEEAKGGVSRKDFVNKLGIAYKEARETKYWIRLAKDSHLINEADFQTVFNQVDSIAAALFTIIRNTKMEKSVNR